VRIASAEEIPTPLRAQPPLLRPFIPKAKPQYKPVDDIKDLKSSVATASGSS
jgi:hypothetical protein